jgi:pimeloyl-ACP methyl ester carboxylesterase
VRGETLVVAVSGWTITGDWMLFGGPGGDIGKEFVEALRKELRELRERHPDRPAAQVWAPKLPLHMFSTRAPEDFAQQLYEQIEREIATRGNIESIVLLGYSCGAVLARRVFCLAHGMGADARYFRQPSAWAHKIDRVVSLSGITRGWEFSSATPAWMRFFGPALKTIVSFGAGIRDLLSSARFREPFIWQMKRGSPFVVSTRIQYVRVCEELRRSELRQSPLRSAARMPTCICLLGAIDELISPADTTELGPRAEFAFAELPGCNHAGALKIQGEDPAQVERRRRIAAAISEPFDSFCTNSWIVPAGDIDDYLDPMDIAEASPESEAGRKVEHAVMVVHGIRDHGFWTKRVAREIKTLARREQRNVRAPTPSYGFFSMWDFVKPGGRQEATHWFMERYADVVSHFPNARISFVGHSNGTYIAAHALTLCAAIQFENVLFAGSVVRRNFRWDATPGSVERVFNYVGSMDGVVAFLPAAFEALRLGWLNVGGAGAFGFTRLFPPTPAMAATSGAPPPAMPVSPSRIPRKAGVEVDQCLYVRGGHGAAIQESHWTRIARFALHGDWPPKTEAPRRLTIKLLFGCAPLITLLGLLVAGVLLALPVLSAAGAAGYAVMQKFTMPDAVLLSLFAALAGWLVSLFLGRVLRFW